MNPQYAARIMLLKTRYNYALAKQTRHTDSQEEAQEVSKQLIELITLLGEEVSAT